MRQEETQTGQDKALTSQRLTSVREHKTRQFNTAEYIIIPTAHNTIHREPVCEVFFSSLSLSVPLHSTGECLAEEECTHETSAATTVPCQVRFKLRIAPLSTRTRTRTQTRTRTPFNHFPPPCKRPHDCYSRNTKRPSGTQQQHGNSSDIGTRHDKRHDKARQGKAKTRQGQGKGKGKARQDKAKTRQGKARQFKTRPDKTRHGKTRQDKTRQDKTRQDKTR